MVVSVVQHKSAAGSFGGSAAATFDNPTTAGNLIAAILYMPSAGSALINMTISDPTNGGYTIGVPWFGTNNTGLTMYYAKNIVSTTAVTVTANWTNTNAACELAIVELAGCHLVAPLDKIATSSWPGGPAGLGPASTGTTATLTGSGDLALAAMNRSTNVLQTWSSSSGFTVQEQFVNASQNVSGMMETKVLSGNAAVSDNISWSPTSDTTGDVAGFVATFLAAADTPVRWAIADYFVRGSLDKQGFTSSTRNTTGAKLLIFATSNIDGNYAVSDNKGNTWVLASEDSSSYYKRIYYAKSPIVGRGHTFTMTGTDSSPSMLVLAVTDGDLTAPLDQVNNGGGYNNVIATGSVTPTVNNELLVTSTLMDGENGTASIDSGFSVVNQIPASFGAHWGIATATLSQGTAATVNPTWTSTGFNMVGAVIASFKPSAATPGLLPAATAAGKTTTTATLSGSSSGPKNVTGSAAGKTVTFSSGVSYAAPKLVAAGTFVSTSTNAATLAPGLPTGWAAGDIHILIAARKDTTAMTALTGWTQYASLSGNNSTTLRTEVWWRRAVGGDTAPTVTFGSGTIARCAQILGFRGCNPSADPNIGASLKINTSSASITTTDITPTGAPTMGLFAFTYPSGPTSATQPTNWTTFVVARSGSGGVAIGYSTRAFQGAAAAYGAPSTTASGQTNSINDGILLSLAARAQPISYRNVTGTSAGTTTVSAAISKYLRGLAAGATSVSATISKITGGGPHNLPNGTAAGTSSVSATISKTTSGGGTPLPLVVVHATSAEALSFTDHITTGAGFTTTSGNLLVAAVATWQSGYTTDISASPALTDTYGNTWTKIGDSGVAEASPSDHQFHAMYYARNCLGGTNHAFTFTVTHSDVAPSIAVIEISGPDTTAPLDLAGVFSYAVFQQTVTSPTFTTLSANDILVVTGSGGNGGAATFFTPSVGGGTYTIPTNGQVFDGAGEPLAIGYQIVSTAKAYAATWDSNVPTNSWNTALIGVAAFKAGVTSGGGGGTKDLSGSSAGHTTVSAKLGRAVAYPLKVSANARYLVDQANKPVWLTGDAAWSAISQLSNADIDTYLAARSASGFNSIICELIEHKFADHAPNNIDNIPPFTGANFTTPNNVFFQRADYVIQQAAIYGITVFLFPLYLGFGFGDEGWAQEVKVASTATMQSWATYVGTRYKTSPNIVWVIGGDVDPTGDATIAARTNDFALQLAATDPNHLISAHNARGQMASAPWPSATWLTLNSAYSTPTGTSADGFAAYAATPTRPYPEIENWYENEHSQSAQTLRSQPWYSLLSGTTGFFFGNDPMWGFSSTTLAGPPPFYDSGTDTDWHHHLQSPGTLNMVRLRQLVSGLPWQTLIPDSAHTVITSGYGTLGTSNYVGCARSADGKLIVAYLPTAGAVTMDMTKLSAQGTAQWYDPSAGTFSSLGTLTNSGVHTFTPLGNNAGGAPDWVLVLQVVPVTATPLTGGLGAPYSQAGRLLPGAPYGAQTVAAPPSVDTAPFYSTSFALTENPISEGSVWIGGQTVGVDWHDAATTPGKVFGTQPGNESAVYTDSIAVLTGAWGPDQDVSATVYATGLSSGNSEVELLLRFNITPHSVTGYEITINVNPSMSYFQVNRWTGGPGNLLSSYQSVWSQGGTAVTGDVMRATIIGSTITLYRNGVVQFTVNDSVVTSGNPGMGFFNQNSNATTFGFTNFTAQQAGVVPPVSLSGTGSTQAQSTATTLTRTNLLVATGTTQALTAVSVVKIDQPLAGVVATQAQSTAGLNGDVAFSGVITAQAQSLLTVAPVLIVALAGTTTAQAVLTALSFNAKQPIAGTIAPQPQVIANPTLSLGVATTAQAQVAVTPSLALVGSLVAQSLSVGPVTLLLDGRATQATAQTTATPLFSLTPSTVTAQSLVTADLGIRLTPAGVFPAQASSTGAMALALTGVITTQSLSIGGMNGATPISGQFATQASSTANLALSLVPTTIIGQSSSSALLFAVAPLTGVVTTQAQSTAAPRLALAGVVATQASSSLAVANQAPLIGTITTQSTVALTTVGLALQGTVTTQAQSSGGLNGNVALAGIIAPQAQSSLTLVLTQSLPLVTIVSQASSSLGLAAGAPLTGQVATQTLSNGLPTLLLAGVSAAQSILVPATLANRVLLAGTITSQAQMDPATMGIRQFLPLGFLGGQGITLSSLILQTGTPVGGQIFGLGSSTATLSLAVTGTISTNSSTSLVLLALALPLQGQTLAQAVTSSTVPDQSKLMVGITVAQAFSTSTVQLAVKGTTTTSGVTTSGISLRLAGVTVRGQATFLATFDSRMFVTGESLAQATFTATTLHVTRVEGSQGTGQKVITGPSRTSVRRTGPRTYGSPIR